MVTIIIIHIAHITCLVTKDAWHAYGVIVVYKIHHGAGQISYFAEPTILCLAGTVMGEVGADNSRGGHAPCQEDKTVGHKKYYID